MSKQSTTELFTVLGEIKLVDGMKRFIPNSPQHMKSCVSRVSIGQKVTCTFARAVATRSQTQLAYHFVLMGYISDHTGYTKEEIHDAVMRMKFGVRKIRLGGQTIEVRKSVADAAKLPKSDMVELITYDLELCAKLEIRVPTPEELGYISNHPTPYHRPVTPVLHEKN